MFPTAPATLAKSGTNELSRAGRETRRYTRICYPPCMPGFNGLRVLSFESRRAKEIAQLISNNGGVPTVAPSTREVPEGPNEDEKKSIRGIIAHEFGAVIFMTGVGARALI